jgi:hypothetical protein
MTSTLQIQDADGMILDDGDADDDEYITEEEFIQGTTLSTRRGYS